MLNLKKDTLVNLTLNARPDERFHLQDGPPVVRAAFDWGFLRRTKWACGDGVFVSWWLVGHLQFYRGTAKIDATRTFMGRHGELGDPPLTENQFVVTTTPSEMHALRWRKNGPGEVIWSNMGGC